jgi:uncharacterized membrane protein (Fun14 family)
VGDGYMVDAGLYFIVGFIVGMTVLSILMIFALCVGYVLKLIEKSVINYIEKNKK